MRKGPLVVDLFCGAGGFSRGFKDIGFNVVFGIDVDSDCCRTFKANFPEAVVLVEDIRNISANDITYLVGSNEVDVVIGSPPCEPFTAANPDRFKEPLDRLYKDPVGSLVLNFIELVGSLRPKVFVMENVPAILDNGLKHALIKEFKSVGYDVYFNILRAEDYGNPSHRVRVFISNVKLRPKKVRGRVRVIDAIGDLPEPSREPVIPNHVVPPRLSQRKLKKVKRLKWGKALIMYKGAKRMLPNLIKLDPYDIAPTVLGSSRFIHPFEDRLLTVREQARLMGYPDNHVFMGSMNSQYNQVGESVPVPLSRAIANYVLSLIT